MCHGNRVCRISVWCSFVKQTRFGFNHWLLYADIITGRSLKNSRSIHQMSQAESCWLDTKRGFHSTILHVVMMIYRWTSRFSNRRTFALYLTGTIIIFKLVNKFVFNPHHVTRFFQKHHRSLKYLSNPNVHIPNISFTSLIVFFRCKDILCVNYNFNKVCSTTVMTTLQLAYKLHIFQPVFSDP